MGNEVELSGGQVGCQSVRSSHPAKMQEAGKQDAGFFLHEAILLSGGGRSLAGVTRLCLQLQQSVVAGRKS